MRNASIIMGLIVGMIVAGGAGYVDGSSIKSAPVATFFWVHTFKLRVYAPAILPMMAVYVSLTMEVSTRIFIRRSKDELIRNSRQVIGDITASVSAAQMSRLANQLTHAFLSPKHRDSLYQDCFTIVESQAVFLRTASTECSALCSQMLHYRSSHKTTESSGTPTSYMFGAEQSGLTCVTSVLPDAPTERRAISAQL